MTTSVLFPLFYFEPAAKTNPSKPERLKQVAPKIERRIACAMCQHHITHAGERIEMHGAHNHRCTNPQGILFNIGCYHEVPGCSPIGASTLEYTWFPGYAWRIVLCANCRAHLGWCFQSENDFFHGLIMERITSIAPSGNNGS